MTRRTRLFRSFVSSIIPWAFLFLGLVNAAEEQITSDELARNAIHILRDRCLSCHNEAKHKGGLVITSREALIKGGDEGATVVPGNADESRLALNLLAEAEVHMPPKDQLSVEEIQVVREWINASLPWDDEALKPDAKPAAIELGVLPERYHPVLALAMSPDSRVLAAARGCSILVFNVAGDSPRLEARLEAHRDAVQSLAWNTCGTLLASGSFQKIVIHGFAATEAQPQGTEPRETAALSEGLTGRVSALAFSPDGQTLYSADAALPGKGLVRVWNLADNAQVSSWTAHDDSIEALMPDAEGKRLFTAGADGLVKMWTTADHSLERKFEGHTGHVLGLALKAGGRDVEGGRRLATASADQQVKVWDIETGEQKVTVAGHPLAVTALTWGVDFPHIVSACEDGVVRLLNETKEGPEKALPAAPDVIYSVAATHDGAKLFAGCHDGLIYCWDKDGKQTAAIGPDTPRMEIPAAGTETASAPPEEAKPTQ